MLPTSEGQRQQQRDVAAEVLGVHPSVPITTVPESVACAKANPGKANTGVLFNAREGCYG